MPGDVVADGPPAAAPAEGGKGKGGGKGRERKQRERKPIPDFEDPDAELKKVLAEQGYKPDRYELQSKVDGFQEKIDRDKKIQDDLTRRIDAAKVDQSANRQKGNAALEATREQLRAIKTSMLALFQQRKTIANAMDEVKSNKAETDAALKKQRAVCGKFHSEDAVDDEIRALEEKMTHSTLSIKDEKLCLRQIKDLNNSRAEVRKLQELQAKRGSNVTTGQSFDEMKAARTLIDGKIDELKAQEKTFVDQLNALKEKHLPKEGGSNLIGTMLDERKQLKEAVAKNIQAIRKMRDEFSKTEDAWYDSDRMVKALKYQIKQRNNKLREERRAAAGEAGEDAEEEEDEDAKEMDYDVADRVVLCEQLIAFLNRYKPKEAVVVAEAKAIEHGDDVDPSKIHYKNFAGAIDEDDEWGTYFAEPVKSKKNKKRDKKMARAVAKKDIHAFDEEDGPTSIQLTLETLTQFSTLSIAAPISVADVDTTIGLLTEKAAYFNEHGKAGKTLKDIQKLEKASRKGGKGSSSKKAAATEEVAEEATEEAAPAEEAASSDEELAADEVADKVEVEEEAPKTAGPAQVNQAFVFIKPHAVTDAVKTLVSEGLAAKGVKVLREGSIASEEIDSKKLIDQHYYAIASKATILQPHQLNVPEDKFEEKFEEEWSFALDCKKVYNAMDGCLKLGIDADEMDRQWAVCKKAGNLVKFGGGFYCGLIELEDKEPIYVFNGFFMSMRSKFTAPGLSIYYYVVEFDANELSWDAFRGSVLGPTDPAEAPADSLRGLVMADWKALGLDAEPNVGDNGVHASASPFEGLAERLNWVGAQLEEDAFGQAMLDAGISKEWITAGCVDPQVVLDADGKKGSLFDSVEDTNSNDCLAKLKELFDLTPVEAPAAAPVKKVVVQEEAAPELDLDAARAAARAKAADFAASLTPEEAAIYGAKVQVAASGVRLDSDSDSEGGADFVVGGDDDGTMLGDY
eukprot:TRINITY_DN2372_c0_g1_i1.p1 TRINITY_DN2372_c0_g1~~TRINITY_DN2372_c0_g1_i1.p1  ORF type:complete len:968 (-),score=420.48 TRINITY_DN2372_c0_g1_i1:110-3013(-)